MLESKFREVTVELAKEVMKLNRHKEGTGATITLNVKAPSRFDTHAGPTVLLNCSFYNGVDHETVRAGSLSALMDEVYRRCGFADKQAFVEDQNNSMLTALEGPKEAKYQDELPVHDPIVYPPVHDPK